MAYAEGFACVDAYHYLYNGEQAGIISPELDLSKDGGNISLSVRLCGENAAYWDVNGDKHEGVVQCAVALFNYSEETGSFEQAELVYTDEVKADWQTFNVQLTQGAAITDSANADAAAEFLDFCLNNADAQKIWQKYGFELA